MHKILFLAKTRSNDVDNIIKKMCIYARDKSIS